MQEIILIKIREFMDELSAREAEMFTTYCDAESEKEIKEAQLANDIYGEIMDLFADEFKNELAEAKTL